MAKKLISVVSPVHNEEENIKEFVSRITGVLNKENWELLLIDDGSTDGSFNLISQLAKKI
jgi:dolichol-phosphate mannosyltransferase